MSISQFLRHIGLATIIFNSDVIIGMVLGSSKLYGKEMVMLVILSNLKRPSSSCFRFKRASFSKPVKKLRSFFQSNPWESTSVDFKVN